LILWRFRILYVDRKPVILITQAQHQGNTLVNVSKSNADAAFVNKEASGWSLPVSEENALEKYADTLHTLYSFYEDANKELYSLMAKWGPASGWNGAFPKSYVS
jgi:hypothetical protein